MPKIMLVEDDNNLREIYGERLLAEGYEIVSASDGEEALALAVKEKPDLIISDVMMPKISGFDMLDILRQTPETKNTQVIMMTALSQAEDKDRADKLGADKYLVKSQVTLEDVARVVHDLIYGPEQQPAAAPEPTTPTVAAAAPVVAAPTVTEPTAIAEPPAAEPIVATAPVASPPEPTLTATPVAAPPAEPVTSPIPATTAPVSEPVAEPVTQPATPATEPAPSPVATPDPTPVAEPAATPVAETNEIATNEPATPASIPEPPQTGTVTSSAQDLASEQADVTAQIESFVESATPVETQHTEPLVVPETNEIIAEAAAAEGTVTPAGPIVAVDLTTPTASSEVITPTEAPAPEEPAVEEQPQPANIPRPMDTNMPEAASTRKKVIAPINDPAEQPNINELYEKEMAQEAATSAVINPNIGGVVGGTDAAAAPPSPLEQLDPTSIPGVTTEESEQTPEIIKQAAPLAAEPTEAATAEPVAAPTSNDQEDRPSGAPDPNNPASFAL